MKILLHSILLFCFSFLFIGKAVAQPEITIEVDPSEVSTAVNEEIQLTAEVKDSEGNIISQEVRFFSADRRSVSVNSAGVVSAMQPGEYELFAMYINEDGERFQKVIPVSVAYPPIKTINLIGVPERIYTQSGIRISQEVIDEAGLVRENPDVRYSVNSDIVTVDRFGFFEAKESGTVSLTVGSGDVNVSKEIEVVENPVASLTIGNEVESARTGDVLRLDTKAFDGLDEEVPDAPVEYSFRSEPDDQLGEGATAQIDQKGRFVANKPGFYTLIAKSGNQVARQVVRIEPRDVQQEIERVGHALVDNVHTSDLWIWEGVDGRDYAITGTWGGNGEAYFWDVTDPSDIIPLDSVTVDARTINDVKISEDGTLAVITREGASTRRNGIVLLDVTNPRQVEIITEYTEGLTGGVHNTFIYENHVYAVNNGTRYDIINIDDPENPHTVSRFELDRPGHSVHDVWIDNGLAYSSNWSNGIVVADVGSNPQADTPEGAELGLGSPSNPVELARYSYPSGWNHAAFPFKSESTGDFYVIAGDEAFPNGLYVEDRPTIPAGWIHFIKFNDWNSPEEVASYRVPEAGTHNFWVEGDILYIAYYNGGLRVVDISGELMGDLYEQGREIAHFSTVHHNGFVPNAAMAWGPQPYKGHIFVSDWNSGLWAFKLVKKES
ncbi:MAG: hypothetical protein WD604_09685 [Balneolaceae bacterium]